MGKKINQYLNKYIWILSVLLLMVLFFQNCSIYKSQGKSEFENLLSTQGTTDCLPYIDANLAAQAMDSVINGVYEYPSYSPDNSIFYCSFQAADAASIMNKVDCDVSSLNQAVAAYEPSMTCASNSSAPGANCGIDDSHRQTYSDCYNTCNSSQTLNSSCLYTCVLGEFYQNLNIVYYAPGTSGYAGQSFYFIYQDPTNSQNYIIKHIASETNSKGASCGYIIPGGLQNISNPAIAGGLETMTETMSSHN